MGSCCYCLQGQDDNYGQIKPKDQKASVSTGGVVPQNKSNFPKTSIPTMSTNTKKEKQSRAIDYLPSIIMNVSKEASTTHNQSSRPNLSQHSTPKPSEPPLNIEPYFTTKQVILVERPIEDSYVDAVQEEVEEDVEPLNEKFENTVRDSVLSIQMPEPIGDTIQIELLLDNGLPNIGNTCYLNSVLQMLYSADKFRNIVIKLSQKPELEFHQLVGYVFQDIERRQTMDKKRQDLKRLVQYIEKKQSQFARFTQNDALQSFLCILNMLQEEYPACSKLNYFKVRYQMRCGCNSQSGITIENYCVKSNEFCIKCKKNVMFLIQNTGPYLIILPNPKTYRFRRYIQFINKDKNYFYYQQKSRITHFGTRNSGHYISHRRVGKKWIEANDSTITIANNLENYKPNPMITLYQFKKRVLR